MDFEKKDNEIIYSKAIKAGKRIYYLDVKKSRNEDLFLAITESKKKVTGGNGTDQDFQVSYEKHKIFLYKEDFSKFMEGLDDVISFIVKEQGDAVPREEYKAHEKESISSESKDDDNEEEVSKSKGFFNKFKF